jgi:fido (protein-threonine AMPylation protein)
MVDATSLPPTTSIEQRQNSPCHCLLNTLPFREGNGRTLKLLFTAIAFRHEVFIDWSRLDSDQYTEALNHWQRTQEPSKIEAVLTACSCPVTIGDTLQ